MSTETNVTVGVKKISWQNAWDREEQDPEHKELLDKASALGKRIDKLTPACSGGQLGETVSECTELFDRLAAHVMRLGVNKEKIKAVLGGVMEACRSQREIDIKICALSADPGKEAIVIDEWKWRWGAVMEPIISMALLYQDRYLKKKILGARWVGRMLRIGNAAVKAIGKESKAVESKAVESKAVESKASPERPSTGALCASSGMQRISSPEAKRPTSPEYSARRIQLKKIPSRR